MPFPLIAVATIGTLAASLGLQAYDTLGKKETQPIYVTTLQPKPETTDYKKYLPYAIIAIAVLFLILGAR